ncbi:hypothetical protein RV10_GL004959 [Enterococcus pallens]|nr:hypothetical protein RV10_GL004959 [Enterococcus pallens]
MQFKQSRCQKPLTTRPIKLKQFSEKLGKGGILMVKACA